MHAVTHDTDVAQKPCMGIEDSLTDMHTASVTMVWCLQLGQKNMLLGFLQLAVGEVVDELAQLGNGNLAPGSQAFRLWVLM